VGAVRLLVEGDPDRAVEVVREEQLPEPPRPAGVAALPDEERGISWRISTAW
jgi:hypothetical protein